ncbi:hypothetical protein RhiirA4_431155 [Rhizophagus irregularis]|uniref:Uncharacterized protein n=1 Tax=Rhizophagus irregularis TaxID=588596 RepID=A0A2I1HNK6_9GLOM|nr:hypothetical protein RhiirA4_431155 [Rhizophagus irregularis]
MRHNKNIFFFPELRVNGKNFEIASKEGTLRVSVWALKSQEDWISFYTIPWVQASLNILHSFISEDIWYKTSDNTNVAESCHANENQDGKSLSLEVAVLKAKKYGNINFITCQTHDQFGIGKTGKDLGLQREKSKQYIDPKVTQTSTSSIVNDDLEKEMISLREKKFELEEKELKLEKERQLEPIYLPFTKSFDDWQ